MLKKVNEGKNLTSREIIFGKKVLYYISGKPNLINDIKNLSELVESDEIEIKFIYDKLLLISKEDWKKIIDIASQTKLFNNLELANVKSVQLSIQKKRKY